MQNNELREEIDYYKIELTRKKTNSSHELAMTKIVEGNFLEKVKMADTCINQIINLGLSPIQKYPLWGANINSGIYSKFRHSVGSSAASFLTVKDQQRIASLKDVMADSCKNIKGSIQNLNEYKDKLLTEVQSLDEIMKHQIYSKMTNEEKAIFDKSIGQVIYK